AWRDSDAELEMRWRRPILDIFAQDGEAAFRDLEARMLLDLCSLPNHVIATGGGVVLREDNRRRLRQAGLVVWLSGDPACLWRRLQADTAAGRPRPALTVGGAAEVEQLLQARDPLYRACADFIVDTAARSPEEVAEAILALLPCAKS